MTEQQKRDSKDIDVMFTGVEQVKGDKGSSKRFTIPKDTKIRPIRSEGD